MVAEGRAGPGGPLGWCGSGSAGLRQSWALFATALGSLGLPKAAQKVKNPPAVQETRVQSLGWEDPLEKEMANRLQYSCLENLMDRGAWWAVVHGVAKSQALLSD